MELVTMLAEYDLALAWSRSLVGDLPAADVVWRPHEGSSAIGWHLGHQAAVAHHMVRNLVAAEPPIDAGFDALFDSATPERDRGSLPPMDEIDEYRAAVADRVRARVGAIVAGEVGAPQQLTLIGQTLMRAVINHEYQHDTWIAEVRADLGHPDVAGPAGSVTVVEGYPVLV